MSLTIQFAVLATVLVSIAAGQESVPKKEDLRRLGAPADFLESYDKAPPLPSIKKCCPKKQNYECGNVWGYYYPQPFFYHGYFCFTWEKHVTHCNCRNCIKEDDQQCFLKGHCSVDYAYRRVRAWCFKPGSLPGWRTVYIKMGKDCSCKV